MRAVALRCLLPRFRRFASAAGVYGLDDYDLVVRDVWREALRQHGFPLSANMTETVRRERRPYLAGANPARQLSLQPVAVGAAEGGNDLG